MNRSLAIAPSLALCDRITCRADDRGVPFELRCVLTIDHKGPCLSEWKETP